MNHRSRETWDFYFRFVVSQRAYLGNRLWYVLLKFLFFPFDLVKKATPTVSRVHLLLIVRMFKAVCDEVVFDV